MSQPITYFGRNGNKYSYINPKDDSSNHKITRDRGVVTILFLVGCMTVLVLVLLLIKGTHHHHQTTTEKNTSEATISSFHITIHNTTFYHQYTFNGTLFLVNENSDKIEFFVSECVVQFNSVILLSKHNYVKKWKFSKQILMVQFHKSERNPTFYVSGSGLLTFPFFYTGTQGAMCVDGGTFLWPNNHTTTIRFYFPPVPSLRLFVGNEIDKTNYHGSFYVAWAIVEDPSTTVLQSLEWETNSFARIFGGNLSVVDSTILAKRIVVFLRACSHIFSFTQKHNVTVIVVHHAQKPVDGDGHLLLVRVADVMHAFENDPSIHKDSTAEEARRADLLIPVLLRAWLGYGNPVLQYASYMVMDMLAPEWHVWDWFWERELRSALLLRNKKNNNDNSEQTAITTAQLAAIAAYEGGSGNPTSPKLQNALQQMWKENVNNPILYTTKQEEATRRRALLTKLENTYLNDTVVVTDDYWKGYAALFVSLSGHDKYTVTSAPFFYVAENAYHTLNHVHVTMTSSTGPSSWRMSIPETTVVTSTTPILINAGRGGLYRVLYEQNLALQLIRSESITARDSAGILDDAWAFAFSLSADAGLYVQRALNLTETVLFSTGGGGVVRTPSPWIAGLAGLARVRRIFEDDIVLVDKLSQFASKILEPAVADFEYGRPRSSFSMPEMRALCAILTAALDYRVKNVVDWATTLSERIHDTSSLPEDLWYIVYRAGVEAALPEDLSEARKAMFSASTTPQERERLLYAIAYTRNSTEAAFLVRDALLLARHNKTQNSGIPLQQEEIVTLFVRMTESVLGRDSLREGFLLENAARSLDNWDQDSLDWFSYTFVRRSVTSGEPDAIKKLFSTAKRKKMKWARRFLKDTKIKTETDTSLAWRVAVTSALYTYFYILK